MKARSNSTEGQVEVDFQTSLAAEIAALRAAKLQIDSKILPLSSNIQTEEKTAPSSQYRDYQYNGLTIQLLPDLQVDGHWRCRYLIFEPRNNSTGKRQGSAAGTFATRSEAEAAALKNAKYAVDSLGPVS